MQSMAVQEKGQEQREIEDAPAEDDLGDMQAIL
jgi:hypothetical protein